MLLCDVDCNRAPFALIETKHAERAAGSVTDEDRDPDVERIKFAGLLNHETDTEWHNDLRNDRDVERTPRVACPLQSTGVRERDGD